MKLAVIFGGVSFEHEISIVSAIVLRDILEFEIEYIFLDENRDFFLIPKEKLKSTLFSSREYKNYDRVILKNGDFFRESKGIFSKHLNKLNIDLAINLIHGSDGEDGKVASLMEFYGVDFVGPRVEASTISYSKYFTKLYAKDIGVNIVDYQLLTQEDKRDCEFNFPVIVKPLKLGSSIGVNIATTLDEFEYALDVAFEFDSQVIIEPFLEDFREFNLAGFKGIDKFYFSKVEEPKRDGKILDFNKKYMDFSRVKAETISLDEDLELKLKEAFAKIYSNIFDGSLIRCDFFYYESRIYLNEINSIPGSLANYLFDDFNLALTELFKSLPKSKKIAIEYNYIDSIKSTKGK